MKTFHNPEIQRIDFLDERFYTVDNLVFYPSVTTILEVFPKGFGFDQWLKDVGSNASEIADRAAKQGTNVHDAIDRILKGEEILWCTKELTYSQKEWGMILKFMEFWNDHKPELITSEFTMCSSHYELGGTLDLICRINGKLWLIDFKTSNYLHKSYELQLSAYAEMYNKEIGSNVIDETGILWLNASTRTKGKGDAIQGNGWQLKTFERSYHDAFKIFQHTHAIWKEENPTWVPKNYSLPDRVKL